MVVGQPGKLVSVLRIVGSSPILVAKTREIIGSFFLTGQSVVVIWKTVLYNKRQFGAASP